MQTVVKMYTLSTCGHCRATKKFFTDCAVKFEFTDVDLLTGAERDAIIREIQKINPNCSFPTIIIGDKIIIGFRENEIRAALGI